MKTCDCKFYMGYDEEVGCGVCGHFTCVLDNIKQFANELCNLTEHTADEKKIGLELLKLLEEE